jgi:tetratricopeptide (TPR) repeat protein
MEYLAKLVDARDDVGFIEFLAEQNMRQGRHRKAKQYYKRLVKLRPGDPAALAKLGEAQAMLGLHARAWASHTKAADIYKTDGNTEGQGSQLMHAGAAGINVATLGPVTRKGSEDQKAKDEVEAGGDDVGDVGADGVQEEDSPTLRKRYLQAAKSALLQATKVTPSDAAAWYLLATAHFVSRDGQATWDAIKQSWKVCKATQDTATRAVTATRLSVLLIKLCRRLLLNTEPQQINWLQLYEALEMAAEVSLEAEEVGCQLDLHQLLELAQEKAVDEPLMLEQLRSLQRSMPKTSPEAMRHFERVASGR